MLVGLEVPLLPDAAAGGASDAADVVDGRSVLDELVSLLPSVDTGGESDKDPVLLSVGGAAGMFQGTAGGKSGHSTTFGTWSLALPACR